MASSDEIAMPRPEAAQWSALPSGVIIPNSPILSAADTARLMGFPSREALAKARRTGRLEVEMFQLSGRRGWFARREEICAWLQQSLNNKEVAS
ncbi:hypothetical protein [Pseudoxanthomonas sp.]|uniref:hypothetical protein n=1 Tax=Pseudoxanthomonas sp. TaxID=1871049 RepID=UPI002608DA36|nr:hypothetical protein [Pseudoxanthomonas sp.]WDS37823.1 MAG: hypothetical protein O8I58_08135 [Pseudoxanthomonas sp.]